ncbi:PIG-L family deacetylase [uncultured Microbacterium sp.]|uniref:PIG-L family deacetylase n=1 Tax=uncultured Microbacterium sp. TaxID=191216 RepID=UPI0035CA9969
MPDLDFSNAVEIRIGDANALAIRIANVDVWETRPDERVVIVNAHQDDDLYFMNPDILTDIDAGRRLVVVYLTAGDSGDSDETYWHSREVGARAAYSQMTGSVDAWSTGTEIIAGKALHVASIASVKHIYVRLPDGGGQGEGFPSTGAVSLAMLWTGAITTIHSLDFSTTFTKAELLAVLRAIADEADPVMVRTLDGAESTHDHPDHQMTSRFTVSALAGFVPALAAYQGYGISDRAANVNSSLCDRKRAAMEAYSPYDPAVQPIATDWLERQYTTDPPAPVVPIGGPGGGGPNVAMSARVLVSSENAGDTQLGVRAIDGVIDGYPGDYTKEWATLGERIGGWIELRWDTPQALARITLYDRPNSTDNILGGTLTFSSGSAVSVEQLDATGAGTTVTFSSRSVAWVRFTITAGAGNNVGLAEIKAFAS